MDQFVIEGGATLRGEIPVSGAKNAALPALAAALLTEEPVVLHRIPRVRDLATMANLLRHTGASVDTDGETLRIEARNLTHPEAPYETVKTMRASSLVLGPLVARCGRARVSMPGGCAIGTRPIDLHILGLEGLGARVTQTHGYIEAEAAGGLEGRKVTFGRITVTGTEDLLMAAVLARGTTVLENAAQEPEVQDLAAMLTKMGARIAGAGTPTITIEGVERLHGTEHTIIPDRIEAGTFLIAGALAGEDLAITGCDPAHLDALLEKMTACGINLKTGPDSVTVSRSPGFRAVDMTTKEHPGFPTDLQAQYMALMTQADGISLVTETIFENRFMHVPELMRMGASIRTDGRQAIVAGPRQLSGAQVMSSDLRASASLVLAALVARGTSIVDRVYHIDRGYEAIEQKLAAAGARISRVRG
ncbi:MAG: UDP-N-acetylglucosamine 1-carboxyvinyltransferase [Bryobacterales bacterium]|nr:UDP-N-acetylglucosamine 1-carboxyvinyltransferase [Bryobacterales bacterium]